jgi:hypothetical protein
VAAQLGETAIPGSRLQTLRDAADYIMKLPKAEQRLSEWQTAGRILIGVAEGRSWCMLASASWRRSMHLAQLGGGRLGVNANVQIVDASTKQQGAWIPSGLIRNEKPVSALAIMAKFFLALIALALAALISACIFAAFTL